MMHGNGMVRLIGVQRGRQGQRHLAAQRLSCQQRGYDSLQPLAVHLHLRFPYPSR